MEQTTQPAPREQRPRRRCGDRRDGVWLRDLDALHGFTPYLFPNRADNEAFIEAQIDLTNIEAYLERKNAGEPAHRYTIFHVIAAAAVKCFVLRPRMNRFIQGSRMYQRNVLTLSFVVKKQFNEQSEEALAFLEAVRARHRDATHHCYAYIIGRNAGIMRYSDDGEPSGTAGMPIIEVMKARGVVDCAVVVTRYFGGILLGAGGLVRAYSHTCALALDAARVCQMHPTERWLFEVCLLYTSPSPRD